MVYAERYVGFYLSYLLPTCIFIIALPVLFLTRNRYNRRPPEESVLGPAVKLLVRGSRERWHINPWATWKHMKDGTFWDSLKPSHYEPSTRPALMNFGPCTRSCWLFPTNLSCTTRANTACRRRLGRRSPQRMVSLPSLPVVSAVVALLQPTDQQCHLTSRNNGFGWRAERRRLEPRSFRTDHLHPDMRSVDLPSTPQSQHPLHSNLKGHGRILYWRCCHDVGSHRPIVYLSQESLWVAG